MSTPQRVYTWFSAGTARAIALSFCAASLAVEAQAAVLPVNCDAGVSIFRGLQFANDGDTLLVSGTCREAVFIPAFYSHLVLEGQGRASIISPDATTDVVTVVGRDITVRGFTISGGGNGISVLRSATVLLDANTIQDNGKSGPAGAGNGIVVGQHAFAFIINNTIQNNAGHGILVHESSSARIGFFDDAAATPGPNKILTNSGDGINISRSAEARIAAATISGNQGDGVRVERRSHAELAGSTISENGRNAVLVAGGSGLDMEIGSGLATTPNSTEAEKPNGAIGVKCVQGGYVNGPIGTLAGTGGAKDIDRTCVDGLTQ